jgi:hypothetical protein
MVGTAMNIVPISLGGPDMPDWHDPQSYDWIDSLPRRALAWEFLRRNAHYRGAAVAEPPALGENWPLVRLEDPMRDARTAHPLWRSDACDDVVALHAAPQISDTILPRLLLTRLRCRVTVTRHEAIDRLHLLFSQAGRFLQLEIQGQSDLETASLMMPALSPRHLAEKRALALRRLSDLAAYGELRPHLYPHDRRAGRFKRVLQTLDGALAGARHREIASAVFGAERVERDWRAGENHLRDHIRRAIGQGKRLVENDYRKLLT